MARRERPRGSLGPAGILSVITGSAGVGKTALAVHWAHRVADKFPDGQLYVNLRGYDAHPASLTPAEALRGFLVALGEQTQHLPDDTDALASLYRTRVARRRMLVVLDNARDAAQIRVLLPGSPQAAVLVTSRSQLAGLVATEGAHLVSLDVFNRYEARDLMIQRLGADRVDAESEAAGKIAACCARLPLALAIATAHAVTQPATPLAAIAAELSDARTVLDILRLDDAVDIAAVFSWSYDALTADAAMLFRALGAHPVPEVSLDAVASLAGVPPARARVLLAELTRANLITEYACQRFTMHDLLLAYARKMRRGAAAEAESQRAISRLLDHYLHSALLAAVLFQPGRRSLVVIPAGAGVTIAALADQQEALAWLQAEHQALIAVTVQAGEQGLDMHVWQLAWCLSEYLNFQGRWNDSIRVQHAALDAAARLGNREAMAFSRRGFGHALLEARRYDEAQAQLRLAQRLFGDNNDRQGEALVLQMMADLRVRQGRHHEALALFGRALQVYEDVGSILGRAQALNNVGMQYARLGRMLRRWHPAPRRLSCSPAKGRSTGCPRRTTPSDALITARGTSAVPSSTSSMP